VGVTPPESLRPPGKQEDQLPDEVAELRRQVAELRERAEHLQSLFDDANDAIMSLTLDGIFTAVNGGAGALLGWSREELLGHHFRDFLTPASRAFTEERTRRLQAGEKVSSIYEADFVCKDGSTVAVEARSRFVRDRAGHPTGIVAIHRDITERKRMEEALRRAEEQYRSIFENALEGIFQTTPDGQILSANPALARMFGYESPGELKAHVTDVSTRYVDAHRRAEVLKMLREQGTAHGVEFQFDRQDGSTFWASIGVHTVRDTTGAIRYYEGSMEDMTQRRMAEQIKDEFVSVVSHELRTPLTSLRGSLGLLASGMLGPLPDKGQRMLEIAVRNTDRLVRLINDILDVERIQSGKVSMNKTTCDMADLMTHAGEVMQAMAEKAGVTLTTLPVRARLWADPDRLIQTLTNLLSNAIKFSPAGGTVWLLAGRREEHLFLQVRDQGRGIPADKLESIFERFQQVDVSDSREKGGTGLGLAICRSIVQQHRGRIWAESTLGEGSTFTLTLPLAAEEQATAPPPRVAPLMPPESGKSPGRLVRDGQARLRVLVAEDDRDLARVLIAMFERRGAIVSYAQTGTAAIHSCKVAVPDLLILDPIMPEQNGYAVVDWMRQHQPLRQIPVVVYGAEEQGAAERQRLTLGPTLFFTKSRISPEDFEQQVLQWLDRILPEGGKGDA